MQKKAYSYIRFSTPQQLKGDSLRRQLEGSRKWAKENGYELDTSLRDLGVSAFSGANRTVGALKKFIDLIEQGQIDEGSVLILESLDRLSREELTISLNLFTGILTAGVKIITLSDRQEYTADSINNIGNLVISLVSMARAHEESQVKSLRVRASWKARVANAHHKKISRRCPSWLRYNEKTADFELIEERAELLREIFRKTIAGIGQNRLANELNEKKVPTWGKCSGWNEGSLQKIIKSRSLIGEHQPYTSQHGKRVAFGEPIKAYYPAVIEEDIFYAAQTARKQRTNAIGRRGKKFSNLLQGMCLCAKCGGTMRYRSCRQAGKDYAYLTCSNAHRKLGCKQHKYFPYQTIESLVLLNVADQVDWFSLVAGVKTNLTEMKRKQASLESQLTESESRASRYAGLFEVATDGALELAQKRYIEILNEQDNIRNELKEVVDKIAAHAMPDADAIHSKINQAIERLRTEKNPHELFELRATINAALRPAVKLFFEETGEGESVVHYAINGDARMLLVKGDETMDFMGKMATGTEALQILNLNQERLERKQEAEGKIPNRVEITNDNELLAFVANSENPFDVELSFADAA
jgi:DNA invertase Pin-like site-specific DNA recombinase/ElaB/YqjD/DUF883 family membrane-anchored ribosome-binding protein